MKAKKKKEKSPEDLKFENEFRKAKLQLEKGAVIKGSSNIPPELESLFLDQIEKFDKAYRKAKRITVFDKIGKPKWKIAEEIPQKKIKKELDALRKKLVRKGIIVDNICPVNNRELYRFITEELFKKDVDDIHIKGMMCHFIYEDFHPNHEYDIKRNTEDFFREIISGKEKVENFLLGKKFKTENGKIISDEKAVEKFNFFRSFYSKFECEKFEFSGYKINDKNTLAEIIFDVKYKATIDGSVEKQTFSGAGKAVLQNKHKWWTIYQFEMPGLKI